MLVMSCGHNINASISSSCCVSNNVEETKEFIGQGQDKILDGASSESAHSSSHVPHLCLVARGSKVVSTLEPNTSCDNEDEDDDCLNMIKEDDDVFALHDMGEIVYHAIKKDKIACSNFVDILSFAMENHATIEQLQAQVEEHEHTIEKLERDRKSVV